LTVEVNAQLPEGSRSIASSVVIEASGIKLMGKPLYGTIFLGAAGLTEQSTCPGLKKPGAVNPGVIPAC
jgi:hypothetical protein